MSDNKQTKTILGPDCKITGQLSLDSDAQIMGEFNGQMRIGGMLELTETSRVKGMVIAGGLRLGGKAQADVVAEHGMELLSSAQLTGHLYTTRLSVVDGAMFEGHVVVGPKAMQAAGELIEKAPRIEGRSRDEDNTEMEQTKPDINTVPKSLDDILQRRRKQQPVGAVAGNGHNGHNGHGE